jgi:hypothetical protein
VSRGAQRQRQRDRTEHRDPYRRRARRRCTRDDSRGCCATKNGSVDVDASSVRVQIDLPFLLRAVKGTIESKVNDKLNKALA